MRPALTEGTFGLGDKRLHAEPETVFCTLCFKQNKDDEPGARNCYEKFFKSMSELKYSLQNNDLRKNPHDLQQILLIQEPSGCIHLCFIINVELISLDMKLKRMRRHTSNSAAVISEVTWTRVGDRDCISGTGRRGVLPDRPWKQASLLKDKEVMPLERKIDRQIKSNTEVNNTSVSVSTPL